MASSAQVSPSTVLTSEVTPFGIWWANKQNDGQLKVSSSWLSVFGLRRCSIPEPDEIPQW
jgi:hypothetical protein